MIMKSVPNHCNGTVSMRSVKSKIPLLPAVHPFPHTLKCRACTAVEYQNPSGMALSTFHPGFLLSFFMYILCRHGSGCRAVPVPGPCLIPCQQLSAAGQPSAAATCRCTAAARRGGQLQLSEQHRPDCAEPAQLRSAKLHGRRGRLREHAICLVRGFSKLRVFISAHVPVALTMHDITNLWHEVSIDKARKHERYK